MKKLILLLCFTLSFSSFVSAQSALNTSNVTNSLLLDYDSESITVAGTALGFTAAKINPTVTDKPTFFSHAIRATCQNTGTAAINVISDGKTATSSIGNLVQPGDNFKVYGYTNIAAFSAIRNTSTSSSLYCTYSRLP